MFLSASVTLILVSVVAGFNLVYGIRAGDLMWPNISIGHVPRLFHFSVDHFYRQSRWTDNVCCAVGLCEATEWWRVWDVFIKQVIHQLLASSTRSFQLIIQIRHQLLHIFHQCGAKTKYTEQENQTSTDARHKVQGHSLWEIWKINPWKLTSVQHLLEQEVQKWQKCYSSDLHRFSWRSLWCFQVCWLNISNHFTVAALNTIILLQ